MKSELLLSNGAKKMFEQNTGEGWTFHFSPKYMRFNALKLIISGIRGMFYESNDSITRDDYEELLNYTHELIEIIQSSEER